MCGVSCIQVLERPSDGAGWRRVMLGRPTVHKACLLQVPPVSSGLK